MPDPCIIAFGEHYRFEPDGAVTPLTSAGGLYIEVLRLDAPHLREFRRRIYQIHNKFNIALQLLEGGFGMPDEGVLDQAKNWFGYPGDIPSLNLNLDGPETNTKPEGMNQCYFARLERGEVPDIY